MEKTIDAIRRKVIGLAANEAVYLFCAFVFYTVFSSSLFYWYGEWMTVISRFLIVPWGSALCLLHMCRREEGALPRAKEIRPLILLFLWVLLPFLYRFGPTYATISSSHGYMVTFLVIYAMTREADAAHRDAALNGFCAGVAAVSFIWAGMMLLCALTVQSYDVYPGAERFGVAYGSFLQAGVHYNNTAMDSLCMMMMCFVGACRHKGKAARLAHLIPGVMMLLVVVLTQSRTGRYSALIAFAAGAYGMMQDVLPLKKRWLRHAAALAAAAVVLVGGYAAVDAVTDAALAHYSGAQTVVSAAAAEETQEQETAEADKPALEKRKAVDSTFSERTSLWKNLFTYWKENPKYLLLGNGAGQTGSKIVAGTIHEANGDAFVHNAYLQLTADIGLIGMALLFAFVGMVVRPVLRVFFARGGAVYPGGRALCMLVIAVAATGMMESQPLAPMTSVNMMLFYALALLCARGSDMGKC